MSNNPEKSALKLGPFIIKKNDNKLKRRYSKSTVVLETHFVVAIFFKTMYRMGGK
jgi:hypothetical protein